MADKLEYLLYICHYERFFSDYPKHQKAFRSFANVPYDELTKNKRFMAHAYTVISAVDGLVENIDDPEMLFEMLLKTGMNHGKRHKIESDSFDVSNNRSIVEIKVPSLETNIDFVISYRNSKKASWASLKPL